MPQQVIFTADILAKLAAQGAATRNAQRDGRDEPEHRPVVKVFNPFGAATWLIAESEPRDPDTLYGLCDLGFGEPELGYVSRAELESIRVMGCPLERDAHWTPRKTLAQYAEDARAAGRITV